MVRKYDAANPSWADYNDSNHKYSELPTVNGGEQDGKHILKWGIEINVPEDYNGRDLTIVETLPAGVELYYLKILADGLDATLTDEGYQGEVTFDASTGIITVPETTAKNLAGKKITLDVWAAITNPEEWKTDENKTERYTNKVTVQWNGKDQGSDEQTQEVSKGSSTGTGKDIIDKKCAGPDQDNTLTYSVVVNPEGKDLLPGVDWLTLTDELTYRTDRFEVQQNGESVWVDSTLVVSYVEGSLTVFELDENGNKIQVTDANGDPVNDALGNPVYKKLGPNEFKYDRELVHGANNDPNCHKWILTLAIPDGKPLQVEYQYKASVSQTEWVNISNNATLLGKSSGY